MGTPRRIKGIDNKITCKSAQKLNDTDADNTLAAKLLQGLWKLVSRLGCCQHLGENIRVLNRLASSLQCRSVKKYMCEHATKDLTSMNSAFYRCKH